MKNMVNISRLITCVIIAMFPVTSVIATNYYVDGNNGDDESDGLSWTSSMRTIGAVMNLVLQSGDQINVAEGVYAEEVTLQTGISLLGGFPSGGGTRNPSNHISFINGENTHRCVIGAQDAVLDGFILDGGWGKSGSGVLHSNISMTVKQCTISNCVATGGTPFGGGGMYFFMSNSIVTNCLFENNSVDLSPDSSATEAMGGAMMMWASSPRIADCTFLNNSVLETEQAPLRLGGAIWASASEPIICGCLFENNSANSGGGIGWWNCSTPLVEDCSFINNTALSIGGGICHIYNERETPESDLWVRNCRFEGNFADMGAGLMITRNNRVVVTGCLFTGNYAVTNGSGICIQESTCRIEYCTFAHNSVSVANNTGGCIHIGITSETTLKSTIISDNIGLHGIKLEAGGDPLSQEIIYCDVWGHWTNYSLNLVDRTGWNGNISVDPVFTDDSVEAYCLSEPDTDNQSQKFAGRSPCIDAGCSPVAGYPQANSTTRTDLFPDLTTVDMGWHRRIPGVHLIADSPYAGEFSVALNSEIRCRLINMPSGVTEDKISATLNDIVVELDISKVYNGFELILLTDEDLENSTDYQVIITVEFRVGSHDFDFIFSTSESTSTSFPPIGNNFDLTFPMQQSIFTGGEQLIIHLEAYNPWLNNVQCDLHIAFEYAGVFYFFPLWDQSLHAVNQECLPGQMFTLSILEFIIPEGLPACGPFIFYALCMESDTLTPVGDIATWNMYFSDE
ncbi:right-handed parallel beta-helix repeat-containing protein [bacterium]|nr:right-handed parallel beta-helix repeat-containing protein [bacterium]